MIVTLLIIWGVLATAAWLVCWQEIRAARKYWTKEERAWQKRHEEDMDQLNQVRSHAMTYKARLEEFHAVTGMRTPIKAPVLTEADFFKELEA